MKADVLLVIGCIIMVYAAWVITGGPSRPIAKQGPYITPVTRSGEESQGYRVTPPRNPIDTSSYPRQVSGRTETITKTSGYNQQSQSGTSSGSLDTYAH